MTKSALRILSSVSSRERKQAECEAFWRKKRFPGDIFLEETRFSKTIELLKNHCDLYGKHCIDLGSGTGNFAKMLLKEGSQVTALDLSETAIECCRRSVECIHDCLPRTRLADASYDVVACLDVIAYLEESEHRLCVSEWARLIRGDGHLICSTPLDVNSEDALERFLGLVETEFVILDLRVSYHRLFNKALRVWKGLKSPRILKILESVTQALYQEQGIDHVILLAKRRSL